MLNADCPGEQKMGRVILICGKMCSGKSTYANSLIKKSPAVLLSLDELTTLFFGPYGGADHVVILEKARNFLFRKSLEITLAGIDVVLDWGFWKQADRRDASLFFEGNHVPFEWHYVDASNDACLRNLKKRNREIKAGRHTSAYYFPEEVAFRFWEEMFEIPTKNEIDVWEPL